MPTHPEVAMFDVDSSVFVHISGQPGIELTCLEGCLWVTQDGSTADIELAAGQRYVVTDPVRLIVCGFGPGSLQVMQQPPATAWSKLWHAMRGHVASVRPAAGTAAVTA